MRQIDIQSPKGYQSNKVYIYIHGNDFYKLHERNNQYGFVHLNSTDCYANGINWKSAEEAIEALGSGTLYEFNTFKEFLKWIVNNI